MVYATTFLDHATVYAVTWPIIETKLQEFGVVGLQVDEEIDFDGEPVLRLGVISERPFTARAMADTRDAIRVQLLERDDQRSVYLRSMAMRVAE